MVVQMHMPSVPFIHFGLSHPAMLALTVLVCAVSSRPASGFSSGPTVYAGPEEQVALAGIAGRLLSGYSSSRGGGPTVKFALGGATESRHLIPERDLETLRSPDAFIIKSARLPTGGVIYACAGRSVRSTGFAFFEVLQRLGFGFLHPLKPVYPVSLPGPLPELEDIIAEPRWKLRGTHYHTQHPLEMTNFLNGYDAAGGHEHRDSWAAQLYQWEAFLDWMLAQKQNYVEWMLLSDRRAPKVGQADGFELSDERQMRLKLIVQKAHERGIEVGLDVPLTLQQQHALSLMPSPSHDWSSNFDQIRTRVQWLLNCGFDHLGTELGTTEFTKGLSAKDLVRSLNLVQHLLGPSRRLLVKNHCSTQQHADGFNDPRPDFAKNPLNFNYLNYYADPTIVSMPHTVQAYSLKDPAPTYGNKNFSDLRDWTQFLLHEGRPVVFYPETSYWVNYDISVPLFLAPVYTKSRVEDANDIDAMGGSTALGQLNFESGWQWGYWLANSAQALVAWEKIADTRAVFNRLFQFLRQDQRALLVELLQDYAAAQKRLLIDGIQDHQPPIGIGEGSLTGMAYLQGSEGLSDMGGLLARYFDKGAPNPDRLRFSDLWTDQPFFSSPWQLFDSVTVPARRQWYYKRLRPLLFEMNSTFAALSDRFRSLLNLAKSEAEPVVETLRDMATPAQLLSLRCSQVLDLYDHAAACGNKANSSPVGLEAWCDSRLVLARQSLEAALDLVPDREEHYGLPRNHIDLAAGWRNGNPTAYNFGYLWAAHKLFYWQRDQAIVERRIYNPCFGNINDPIELGFEGGGSPFIQRLRDALSSALVNRFWKVGLGECLSVSEEEPALLDLSNDLPNIVRRAFEDGFQGMAEQVYI
mmetsp:Transcript_74333/g.131508  ORF Transcript_74333/g.131508 Transcript_74333/m.131508 type:complete len:863 (-) Transcript_74333:126-2714(-)